MTDQLKMDGGKSGGPVECLGITFPSEEARREHFSKLLAEKLKDPSFRALEGFPEGTDEAILGLSDPPYFSACPNPFLGDFIKCYGSPYEQLTPHIKEPFAADVSEGKNDPIYNAHSYHTKVPHRAIMRYILHYTQPGEIIYDGFCGTGMTGVAAQMCGNRAAVEALGFRVDSSGIIYEAHQEEGRSVWKPFSKLGIRRAILNDIAPAATFIAYNYNSPADVFAFAREARTSLSKVISECGWMYQTLHAPSAEKITDGLHHLQKEGRPDLSNIAAIGQINYTVWSDAFNCNECAGELVFWDVAVDEKVGAVRDKFDCPHCSATLTKRSIERAFVTQVDPSTNQTFKQAKQSPVLINYSVGKKRYEKKPDSVDLAIVEKIEKSKIENWHPTDRMMEGREARRNDSIGITHVHQFYTKRNLSVLASLRHHIDSSEMAAQLLCLVGDQLPRASKMHKIAVSRLNTNLSKTAGILAGTLYVPSNQIEYSVLKMISFRIADVSSYLGKRDQTTRQIVFTGSSTNTLIPNDSLDYIFIDPPFGANISYSELNFLWEAWLGVFTNINEEAVQNKGHGKTLNHYRILMTECFREAYRKLKPGRWMTVEFSNTQASVWNSIQTSLQEAGFVVANVAALDKKQGSFKAVTTTTAVKQDLVISAYKPNGGLEARFLGSGGGIESVWDFVTTHLGYLPVTKIKVDGLEYISERDPRIIFDRMVAWFVRHNFPVPLSSQEFQDGLRVRFPDRDGMVFLPEQVTEYDRKRSQVAQAPQMEMFVADERSAIDWLIDFLKKRPSTYQELHPDFMSQLGVGWKKHESRPELSALLEDNFLRYGASGDVPSQIHGYLSTNFKDIRGLEKHDPRLKAKAKDRWYVPDPSKAKDLEQKRERTLLKEFETYKSATKRQLKESRLEVLRTGFKTAWAAKDYKTIIGIAEKLPDQTLQEDEKLLLWYDQALTRTEADA
ncbi:MAG: DNA methyltransferase [Rhizobiaceae bacterium]|nr:DNA methyltransferase [Rhizobiaceae bacterium]